MPYSFWTGTNGNPYWIGLLFTNNWTVTFVTERGCAAPISKVGSFSCRQENWEKLSGSLHWRLIFCFNGPHICAKLYRLFFKKIALLTFSIIIFLTVGDMGDVPHKWLVYTQCLGLSLLTKFSSGELPPWR